MALQLTQQEADALLRLEKHCDTDKQFDYPDMGGVLQIPLFSGDRREEFTLDIQKGRIALRTYP